MSPEEQQSSGQSQSRGPGFILVGLKIVELCLIILCIGLIDDPATNSNIRIFMTQRTIGLCYATFGAYLIYSAAYIVMKLFGDIHPWRTAAFMSVIAIILFLACTTMLLMDWSRVKERNYWPPNVHRLDLICASGFISLIVAILYMLDLIITLRVGMKTQSDY